VKSGERKLNNALEGSSFRS